MTVSKPENSVVFSQNNQLHFNPVTKESRRAPGLCGTRASRGKSAKDRPDPPDKLLPLHAE